MHTIVKEIDRNHLNIELLMDAAKIIKSGGLVAFPTETVYGLGADGLNEDAAKKIYCAKGRPSDNPLILHISELSQLNMLVNHIPETVYKLADAFWPGPLTIILNKSKKVPYGTTGGLNTVAVRMPADAIARMLIEASGLPIAAPSANISGRPSPTLAEHVIEDMNGRIDMILDGGPVGIGLESTILDLTSDIPMILRPGYITLSMLEAVIGVVEVDRAIENPTPESAALVPKAPGMKYRHYAPKGELLIIEGDSSAVTIEINRRAEEKEREGYLVGIIGTEETIDLYHHGVVKNIGSREDESAIAKNLYRILREFDQLNVDYIYTESFHSDNFGQAIMNRLLKAAGYLLVRL